MISNALYVLKKAELLDLSSLFLHSTALMLLSNMFPLFR